MLNAKQSERRESAGEWKVLFDAIFVGFVDPSGAAQAATPLGIFRLQKMPLAGARTQHFSAGSDLEAFRYRLFCLNTLGTSHKCSILSKERAI